VVAGVRDAGRQPDRDADGARDDRLLGAAAAAGQDAAGGQARAGGGHHRRDGAAGLRRHRHRQLAPPRGQRRREAPRQHRARAPHAPAPPLPRRAHQRPRQVSVCLLFTVAGGRRARRLISGVCMYACACLQLVCVLRDADAAGPGEGRQDGDCFHPPAQQRGVRALRHALPAIRGQDRLLRTSIASMRGCVVVILSVFLFFF
jgi:hypothetical protein